MLTPRYKGMDTLAPLADYSQSADGGEPQRMIVSATVSYRRRHLDDAVKIGTDGHHRACGGRLCTRALRHPEREVYHGVCVYAARARARA